MRWVSFVSIGIALFANLYAADADFFSAHESDENTESEKTASRLEVGRRYTLELPNGSILKDCVFQGREGSLSIFEISAAAAPLRLNTYRVVETPKTPPWFIAIAPALLLPQNQRELGFSQGLAIAVTASVPLWQGMTWYVPRLVGLVGFSRYSGSKALLSGPEAMAGPGWMYTFGKRSNYYMALNLTAGAAFYDLLNQKIDATFHQTTFLAAAELGYGYRFGAWAAQMSYAQNFIYDSNFPFTTGAVRLAVVYFGGGT